MKILKNKSGFTLIELLVAMGIFVVFIGILISSYGSLIRAYAEANQYREVYVEARDVFETLVREIRDGMVDYDFMKSNPGTGLILISKDGLYRTEVVYNEDKEQLTLKKNLVSIAEESTDNLLNNNIHVTDFEYYVSPSFDPYDEANYKWDNAFQPMVTIYAKFEYDNDDGNSLIEGQSFDLQTTITSRIYNQVYETNN
jgi:prepilin-type N-terminal cleavage/methylation domain-containing protein